MKETLTIKEFGPIQDMTLELRAVTIFIGDQGTGKSTVAKVLSLVKMMFDLVYEDESKQTFKFKEYAFQEQLEVHGLSSYLKKGSFIEFNESENYFKYADDKIEVNHGKGESKIKNTRIREFIPSYREAAILLKDSLNAIAAVGTPLPKLFYFFGQRVINAKKAKKTYDYREILDVSYEFNEEGDVIIMKNGKRIMIEDASSAVQSGIPLLLAFDNAVESMRPTRNRIYHQANRPYIIIEEPELNFFPATQKKIMEYFISNIKYDIRGEKDFYCGLVITTHSPYILTSLNNMMYGYEIGQKDPSGTKKILSEEYWMNPDDVAAYLLGDGTCEDIFDREEKLIKAEKIDGISGFLNEQFDDLLHLDLV